MLSLHVQVFWFYTVFLPLHTHTWNKHLLSTYHVAVSILDMRIQQWINQANICGFTDLTFYKVPMICLFFYLTFEDNRSVAFLVCLLVCFLCLLLDNIMLKRVILIWFDPILFIFKYLLCFSDQSRHWQCISKTMMLAVEKSKS